jgi:hypothetical protein
MYVKIAAIIGILACSPARAEDYRLTAVWNPGGGASEQALATWTGAEISKFKRVSSREQDPATGQIVSWSGTSLSGIVEKALSQLPPEKKAQFDLIVARNAQGAQALIPRSIVNKYPLLLGQARDGGPMTVVVPWTSRSKIRSEELPLQTFFVSGVSRIEFTSYREKYGNLFLKRRTDPAAMRGEKLFVKNCVGCHDGGGKSPLELSAEVHARKLASAGHPAGKDLPKLAERDLRAVVSYLDAYRAENPRPAQPQQAQPSSSAFQGSPHAAR